MTLVSKEEYALLRKEVEAWVNSHNMFSSARGSSMLAAIEFTLNRQGKTMYEHMVEE